MAGVSEMPFRVIALDMGAALTPTELISSKGLMYKNERTQKYLTYDKQKEVPFWVQLFGGEVESMAIAAELAVEAGADMIDINMGCPVKKVTKTGAGSGLLCDPPRAAEIVTAMKKRVTVPITCKIRTGWDANAINCVQMARTLEDAGAASIALHARTRAQGYSGKADWSMIARVKEGVRHIPVIGNGDVTSRADGLRMLAETGCDAVMIGRGALGNPWIFRALNGDETPPSLDERADLILRHMEAHTAFIGDELRAVRQMRQHLIWYSRGLRGGKKFREEVVQPESVAQVKELVDFYFRQADVERMGLLDDDDVDYRTALG